MPELVLPETEKFYIIIAKDDNGEWDGQYIGSNREEFEKVLRENKSKRATRWFINPNPTGQSSPLIKGVASDKEVKESKARMDAIEAERKKAMGIKEPTEEEKAAHKAKVDKAFEEVEKPRTRLSTLTPKDDVNAPGNPNTPLKTASQPVVKK